MQRSQLLDLNFVEAILIWAGKNKKIENLKINLMSVLPLLCVHYGMSLMLDGEKKS